MKQLIEAVYIGSQIQPKHEVEIVCKACGYDLTPAEIEAAEDDTVFVNVFAEGKY
jgi:hypothetical protein